jgi:hypothetical protein
MVARARIAKNGNNSRPSGPRGPDAADAAPTQRVYTRAAIGVDVSMVDDALRPSSIA